MNMKHLMAAAAAAMVAAGCCDKGKCDAKDGKAADAEKAADVVLPAEPAKNPNEVVAEAVGEKLTRAELDAQAAPLVEAFGRGAPPDRAPVVRRMAERRVVQAFISGKVLHRLAADKGYTLTPEEIAAKEVEFIDRIKGQPGAPQSIDELVAMQPGDPERNRAQIRDGFLFEKLLEGEVLAKDTADYTAEAQKIIDGIAEKNAKIYSDETAQKRIAELKAELDAAPDAEKAAKFAELAKAHSDCPSGARGGDLDFFGHGMMVPEFDQAAFALDVGAISAPVKTQFGYHLIMTTDKKKDDDGEKVRASHILLKVGEPMALPAVEEVVKELKLKNNRTKVTDFMQDALRAFDIKVADEFKDLVPPPKPAPAPAPAPEEAAAPAPAPAPAPEAAPAPAE